MVVPFSNGNGRDQLFGQLFHGLAHELKSCGSAWELVSARAAKLASHLNGAAGALSTFVDALQSVSDCANNVHGISRDIGAALTRFCIRQRAIEHQLRALAHAMQAQFATELERKSADWRQSVADLEKRHNRSCKRKRTAGQPQQQIEVESRNAFVDLLHSQRTQFTGFTSALLPAINAELALLEEGTHVRQVRDSIEQAINGEDGQQLVQALLEDMECSAGGREPSSDRSKEESRAWDQRVGLGVANQRAKSASQLRLCPSTSSGLDQDDGCSLIYGNSAGAQQMFRGDRSSMPPAPSLLQHSASGSHAFLGRLPCWAASPSSDIRHSMAADLVLPPPPTANGTLRPHTISAVPPAHSQSGPRPRLPIPGQFVLSAGHGPLVGQPHGHGSPSSASSSPSSPAYHQTGTVLTDQLGHAKPPVPKRQSSNGNGASTGGGGGGILGMGSAGHYQQQGVQFRSHNQFAGPGSSISASANSVSIARQNPSRPFSSCAGNGPIGGGPPPLSSSSEDCCSSSVLIAETLEQIDRLGLELDSYCHGLGTGPPTTVAGQGRTVNGSRGTNRSLPPLSASQLPVRFRPDTLAMGRQPQRANQPPPPVPPARRNSSISAATPTAPSIAELRLAGPLALGPTGMGRPGIAGQSPVQSTAHFPAVGQQLGMGTGRPPLR